MAKLIVDKLEVEITEDEYLRLRRMAERPGGNGYQLLNNGVIVNRGMITAIFPTVLGGTVPEDSERPPLMMGAGPEEPDPKAIEVPEPEKPSNIITGEQFTKIFEASELSQAAFAATIGYSSAAVRIALKEGRISQEFSDTVMKKYSTYIKE